MTATTAKLPQALEDDVGNWTLASDCLLLDHLKDISKSIQSRSNALIQQLERLDFDLSDMDVGLRNTFNDFLMLGNTQFIENRVYEDDSDGTDMLSKPPDSSTNSVPVDIFATFKEAFLSGQKALNTNDSNQDPIKVDIYNTRPLPYIFGTQQFMQSLDAGLGGIIHNELSASHNTELIESHMNGGDLEDMHNPNHQHRLTSSESSPRTGSLSSFSEDRSADVMNSNTISNATSIAPASPQNNTRAGAPPSLPPPPPPSIPPMPSYGPPAVARIDSHSYEGRSDEDDDDTPSRLVIPPARPSQWAPTVPAQPMAPPPPPLLPADSTRLPPPPPLPQSKPPAPPQEVEVEVEEPDLFEADRDDPYSLFAPQRKTIKSKVNNSFADLFANINDTGYSANVKTATRSDSFSGIFNSSNDDALFNESGSSNTKAVPLDTQPKSSVNSFLQARPEDSFLDKKVNLPVAPPPVPPPVPPAPAPAPIPAPSKGTSDANKVSSKPSRFASLFEDDDDDSSSLFSSTSSSSALLPGKANMPTTTSSAVSTSSSSTAGRKKSIFEDDDNDSEDLFTSRPVSKAPSIQAVTPSSSSSSSATADKKNKLKFLFDDGDDDGDAFAKPVTSTATTADKVVAAPAVPPPPAAAAPAPAPAPTAGPVSIAPPPQLRPPIDNKDDDDDDDDDSDDDWGDGKSKPSVVRPPIPPPFPTKAPPPPQRKKTLFDDDDD